MAFEKFVPPRRQKSPQVSIKSTGTISFDKAYAASIGFGDATHVLLFFDPQKKLIGVKRATGPRDEGALKLSHRKRVSSVRGRTFFEHYGISLETTRRFPVRYEPDEDMAIIEIQEIKRRRGPRKRNL